MESGLREDHDQNNITMVIDSVFLKEFEVFLWLGPITIVTVYNVTMVTMDMLYTYHFQCVDHVLLIHKST